MDAMNRVGVDRGEGLLQNRVPLERDKETGKFVGLSEESYYKNPTLSGHALEVYSKLKESMETHRKELCEKREAERKKAETWRRVQDNFFERQDAEKSESESESEEDELHAGEIE